MEDGTIFYYAPILYEEDRRKSIHSGGLTGKSYLRIVGRQGKWTIESGGRIY